jgi:hypothetical protein
MGLEEYEIEGRPDGRRVHGMESLFHFHQARINAQRLSNPQTHLGLSSQDCLELFEEGLIYYQRLLALFRLRDWSRVRRDATRCLQLIEFVKCHAQQIEDRVQLEPWRCDLVRIHGAAKAMILFEKDCFAEASEIAYQVIASRSITEELSDPNILPEKLLESVGDAVRRVPILQRQGESVFMRQNDYWLIRYQGQSAFLKASRGLACIACLLRNPTKEFHVTQLFAGKKEVRATSQVLTPRGSRSGSGLSVLTDSDDLDPILDLRAKSEYQRRVGELRQELAEAQQFNDPVRGSHAEEELAAIAHQLALATGLGGRDRHFSHTVERARCAVTKSIKETVRRVNEAIPPLGHHLTARIRTGYYCSYHPHPDRPVTWEF